MIRVLVTGADGALGKFVIRSLLNKISPVNIVMPSRADVDLTKIDDVRRLCSGGGFDYVIHCAALWNGINSDKRILEHNLRMTWNLIKSIDTESLRLFSYISSSAVYQDREPLETEGNLAPKSTYGVSKIYSERTIRMEAESKGFSYTIWRPFHIVSPEEKFKPGSSHVCTDMSRRIIELEEELDLDAFTGNKLIGFTWVEDIADCIVDSLLDKRAIDQVFNIGTTEKHTVRELVEQIMVSSGKMKEANISIHDDQDKTFDNTRRKLGWIAKTSFVDCISNFINYKY